MTENTDNFGAFAFYWELTNYNDRLKVGFNDHSSWNTILWVGKMSPRDFPDDEEKD